MITRRAFTAALSLTGLTALAGFAPLQLITDALAQGAADVAKPQSLPDMALGPANAPVTITGNRPDAKSLFGVMTQSAEHRRDDAPALAALGA